MIIDVDSPGDVLITGVIYCLREAVNTIRNG